MWIAVIDTLEGKVMFAGSNISGRLGNGSRSGFKQRKSHICKKIIKKYRSPSKIDRLPRYSCKVFRSMK